MSKVAVQLLIWNGKGYLPDLFAALRRQSFRDFELLVLDNGSSDGSADLIGKLLEDFPLPARFVRSEKNLGFAGGHDRLFAMSSAPYVCCLNQDAVPDAGYLERLVAFLDAQPSAASVSGVLLRPDGSVDTSGIARSWYGKFYDRTVPLAVPAEEVFGVSGALPLYRRSAVAAASPDGSLFDASFFAYKEDVDLAWRLRRFGYRSFAVDAAARHSRGFGRDQKWKADRHFRQRLSSRNHLLALAKNLEAGDIWRLPAIIAYELGKWLYTAVFVPKAAAYPLDFLKQLPETLKARKVIRRRLKQAGK